MEGQHQAMEEGKTGCTLKELDHMRTGIKPILPGPPRLQGGAGNLQLGSGLPLGQPLGLSGAILLKECSTLEAIPTLVTAHLAIVFLIDDSAHSSLLA